jgi:hypothetical protein
MCREIVEASRLPMSIVIVGIGRENFSSMDLLDSDDRDLRDASGREAVRDIVQFFPFRKYNSNGTRLAQAVLAELPSQVSQFMRCTLPASNLCCFRFLPNCYDCVHDRSTLLLLLICYRSAESCLLTLSATIVQCCHLYLHSSLFTCSLRCASLHVLLLTFA